MAELTPMMRQYFEIKNQNQDGILLYRLGDFTKCSMTMQKLHRKNWIWF